MAHDSDTLEILSTRLAALLWSEESIQSIEPTLETQLITLEENKRDIRRPRFELDSGNTLRLAEVRNIGIWEPKVENGKVLFVRTQSSYLRRGWADVDCIGPKSNKSRVVLLGESVARGYLIDPYFNCATALQHLLVSATGTQWVEVVDLAKAGLMLVDLKKLLVSALALEPDAYVIFAGNNWNLNTFASALDTRKIAIMLRATEKWETIRNYAEETIREQVRAFVKYLGAFSAENRVPIIFVIPEFNLLDWRIECGWRSPLTTTKLMRRSLGNRVLAEKALADGNLDLAATLAGEMIQIDEEMNPVGFEILAACNLNRGEVAEARRLKNKAVDIGLTLTFSAVPRCYSVAQEVLRQESAAQGMTLIDLPQRFEERYPDALPGRRFFFDHCHMTVEGMCFAMASTAEKLLPLFGKPEQLVPGLNRFDFEVDNRGNALAHFIAAYENAIWGQNYEIVRFHCSEAVRQAPEVVELARLFIEMEVRQTNIKYTREIENVLGKKGRHCYGFHSKPVARHIGRYAPAKVLDEERVTLTVIRSLADAFSEGDPRVKRDFDTLLKREHGVASHEIDLLCRPYMDLTYGHIGFDWQRVSIYLRSYRAESNFHLICERPCSVRLSLICRVPTGIVPAEPVELIINGVVAHSFFASTRWTASNWTIPAELLRDGIIEIQVISFTMIAHVATEQANS